MTTPTLTERTGIVTFRGCAMTLIGPGLEPGMTAPDFTMTTADLTNVTLDDTLAGGTRSALFIVVPSLDTPTCSIETTTFQRRILEVPPDAAAYVISLDLPFAQKRWSVEHEADGLTYLSDFRDRTFGTAYGVLMKETGLFARAVFVIGKDRTIKYVQFVPDISDEPSYDAAFAALASA